MQLEDTASRLADVALERAGQRPRFVLALTGPPGVGKSTLSDALVKEFARRGQGAAIVPMDGFHLDNAVLEERGLMARKGAPFTFDADGYAALLRRLRDEPDQDIAVPVFDRMLDMARGCGRIISPSHRFLIAEGNYLLLPAPPWVGMSEFFDLSVILRAGHEELRQRLIDRWIEHGLEPDQALARAMSNDIPNAELVLKLSKRADLEILTGAQSEPSSDTLSERSNPD